jgi:hypothetical protein
VELVSPNCGGNLSDIGASCKIFSKIPLAMAFGREMVFAEKYIFHIEYCKFIFVEKYPQRAAMMVDMNFLAEGISQLNR